MYRDDASSSCICELFASTSTTGIFDHLFSSPPISLTCPLFPSSGYVGSGEKTGFPCATAVFFRRHTKKRPTARAVITIAVPRPIPALAAEDRVCVGDAPAATVSDEIGDVVVLELAMFRPADVVDDADAVEVEGFAVELEADEALSLTRLVSNKSRITGTKSPSVTIGCVLQALYVVSAMFPITTPPSCPCKHVEQSLAYFM